MYDGSAWVLKGDVAAQIASGPQYTWTIDNAGKMKKYKTTWEDVAGDASNLGIGAEGSVFIITKTETAFEGNSVQKWVTDKFVDVENFPPNLVNINVDYKGEVWATDLLGYIHNYTNKEWLVQDGNAGDVIRGIDN
jgi:hypothetical protein